RHGGVRGLRASRCIEAEGGWGAFGAIHQLEATALTSHSAVESRAARESLFFTPRIHALRRAVRLRRSRRSCGAVNGKEK
ncbi:MAG: hypothetical protein ABWY48_09590, partial [Pseudoxanthomonas sp.]